VARTGKQNTGRTTQDTFTGRRRDRIGDGKGNLQRSKRKRKN
jgi:hypothetical protein